MSAARNQLLAVTKAGLSLDDVAHHTGIPVKRLREAFDSDWPLAQKHRDSLEAFTRNTLRRAYTNLLATYEALFGACLLNDAEVPR